MASTFPKIILLGRPASGKSEFIDFVKNLPLLERKEQLHIGSFTELDDFLWLWDKFIEDDHWEVATGKRLFSKRDGHGYTITDYTLLDFCFAKFNEEITKLPKTDTVLVEFARGLQDGGYAHALSKLSDEILQDASIVFIWTTFEESCRRNEARYQEKMKHSVLAHKVPEEDMKRFGEKTDWLELTKNEQHGYISVRGHKVPFVTMNNMPELKPGPELKARYQQALQELWKLFSTRS